MRVALFGIWYRLSVAGSLGLGPRDHDLIRAMGRVMELHHQVLFRWSRVSLLQLSRGMPEDHHVAAAVDPSAYSAAASAPSRIAEAILTLRTMGLSTYENRRVTTGTLIMGSGSAGSGDLPSTSHDDPADLLTFGIELTGLKTMHRLCDGRRTLFLIDRQGRLTNLVDIRQWATQQAAECGPAADHVGGDEVGTDAALEAGRPVPCPRVYEFHALATRTGGHVCLVLSPNQEIKVFAGGFQAFVFAHGRWRVIDPESKFALWAKAVVNPNLGVCSSRPHSILPRSDRAACSWSSPTLPARSAGWSLPMTCSNSIRNLTPRWRRACRTRRATRRLRQGRFP